MRIEQQDVGAISIEISGNFSPVIAADGAVVSCGQATKPGVGSATSCRCFIDHIEKYY
jgi:hypothetical protein